MFAYRKVSVDSSSPGSPREKMKGRAALDMVKDQFKAPKKSGKDATSMGSTVLPDINEGQRVSNKTAPSYAPAPAPFFPQEEPTPGMAGYVQPPSGSESGRFAPQTYRSPTDGFVPDLSDHNLGFVSPNKSGMMEVVQRAAALGMISPPPGLPAYRQGAGMSSPIGFVDAMHARHMASPTGTSFPAAMQTAGLAPSPSFPAAMQTAGLAPSPSFPAAMQTAGLAPSPSFPAAMKTAGGAFLPGSSSDEDLGPRRLANCSPSKMLGDFSPSSVGSSSALGGSPVLVSSAPGLSAEGVATGKLDAILAGMDTASLADLTRQLAGYSPDAPPEQSEIAPVPPATSKTSRIRKHASEGLAAQTGRAGSDTLASPNSGQTAPGAARRQGMSDPKPTPNKPPTGKRACRAKKSGKQDPPGNSGVKHQPHPPADKKGGARKGGRGTKDKKSSEIQLGPLKTGRVRPKQKIRTVKPQETQPQASCEIIEEAKLELALKELKNYDIYLEDEVLNYAPTKAPYEIVQDAKDMLDIMESDAQLRARRNLQSQTLRDIASDHIRGSTRPARKAEESPPARRGLRK